jgi:SAM-dependent methyltransferase
MIIDWLALWRELVLANPLTPQGETMVRYKKNAIAGPSRPDTLLDFVLKSVRDGDAVLDIGAGNGRWTIPFARIAGSVTAIEPDPEMQVILQEKIQSAPHNIRIIESSWEEAPVAVHDITVCAHAMYSSPDFARFVLKMEQHARRACYLEIRLPPADGIIGELSRIIYGRTFDSVNAVIAYNALYSMGIYANILVEKEIYPWVNTTFEEAFQRARRHLRLESKTGCDQLVRETLERRLVSTDQGYIWPDGMRSALLWWSPTRTIRTAEH